MRPKYTPFLILILVAVILSIVTAFNGLILNNEGGNSLGGAIALIFGLSILGLLAIEQAIVKAIKCKLILIWIVEIVLIVPLCLFLIFQDPTFYFKVNGDIDWFAVYYDAQKSDSGIVNKFPNDKIFPIGESQLVFVNSSDIGERNVQLKRPQNKWKTWGSSTEPFTIGNLTFKCTIYYYSGYEFTRKDSSKISEFLKTKIK